MTTPVYNVATAEFVYEPPPAARHARRILIKPNLGYPVGPPVTVGLPVLAEVIRAIQTVNPGAEILIVEGVCHALPAADVVQRLGLPELLSERARFCDADALPCIAYPHVGQPERFVELWAPSLLREVDCRISISALKTTVLHGELLVSAALKNLYGLFPRERYKGRSPHSRGQLHRPSVPRVLRDVHGCVGHLFDGAVVDATVMMVSPDWRPDRGVALPVGRVLWGQDLLAVDQAAGELARDQANGQFQRPA